MSTNLSDVQSELSKYRATAESVCAALPGCLITHMQRVTALYSRFSALMQQQRQRAQQRRQQRREEEKNKRQLDGLDVSTVSEVAAEAGLDFSLQEVEELMEATDAPDDNIDKAEEKEQELRQADFEREVKREWQERVVAPLSSTTTLSTSWLSALSAILLRLTEEEVRMERLLIRSVDTEGEQARGKGVGSDDSHEVWSRYATIIAQVKQELMQQHVSAPHITHTTREQHRSTITRS